jgi:hypothetical protein
MHTAIRSQQESEIEEGSRSLFTREAMEGEHDEIEGSSGSALAEVVAGE